MLSYYFFLGDRRPWSLRKPMDLTEKLTKLHIQRAPHKLMTAMTRGAVRVCSPLQTTVRNRTQTS